MFISSSLRCGFNLDYILIVKVTEIHLHAIIRVSLGTAALRENKYSMAPTMKMF